MITTPATISHIEYSASGEVTFVRCTPLHRFDFAEGQFMMISSDHNHPELGKPLKKPYSIATTHNELANDGTIGFIVKKVRDGFMSDHLTTGIHTGDIVHLQGPLGHMTRKPGADGALPHAYLLMSVGSGLSPMVGLFHAIRAQQPDAMIEHIFGERYIDHVPHSLQVIMGGEPDAHIRHTLCLSRQHEKDPDYFVSAPAHIQQGYVQDTLTAAWDRIIAVHKPANIAVFLCGKPEMVDSVRILLEEKGLAKEQIQFEKY